MFCRFHNEQYWHVFMGRGATRYECKSCLRRLGYIVTHDRIGVSARKPVLDEEPQVITPPCKARLMAGR